MDPSPESSTVKLAAALAVSTAIFIYWGFTWRTDPVKESMRMINLLAALKKHAREARKAWRQAGAARLEAERLQRDGGDPWEISRFNLRSRRYSKKVREELSASAAVEIKLARVMSNCEATFGSLQESDEALLQAGSDVALAGSSFDDMFQKALELMRGMGTLSRFQEALNNANNDDGSDSDDSDDDQNE